MIPQIKKPKLLIIAVIVVYAFTAIQFFHNQHDHVQFRNEGVLTSAKVSYFTKYFSSHYRLEFITNNGKKIHRSFKCYKERGYTDVRVIYLPTRPEEFITLKDFNNYAASWSAFFLFGPSGFMATWIFYNLLRFVDFLKKKKNRNDFRKIFRDSY